MSNDRIWPAMAQAYESTKGDLAARLLAALEAGQRAGGDIRGQQSAAIIIVKGKRSSKPWQDRIMDLRVEDNPHPIAELKRLVRTMEALARLAMVGVVFSLGALVLAMLYQSIARGKSFILSMLVQPLSK